MKELTNTGNTGADQLWDEELHQVTGGNLSADVYASLIGSAFDFFFKPSPEQIARNLRG